MIKWIKNNIGMLLLLSTIVTFNIIIGANEKGLRIKPISILMGLILIFLIIKKIKDRKQRIFLKSKIDYLVLAFIITTSLPILFKTWVSYSDTIEFLMKYVFYYSVYILTRNVIKNQKDIELIITVTLIGALIQIILGICIDGEPIFKKLLLWLNVYYSGSTNYLSTFGYANAQAVYSAFCIFLLFHKFKVHKNKVLKIIDVLYIILLLYFIYLLKCRAINILLIIAVISLVLIKYKKQILDKKKLVVILLSSASIIITIFLIISLNISKPVLINNEDKEIQLVYNFEKNKKYNLEMDISTYSAENLDNNDLLEIEIIQRGPYFKKTTIAKSKIEIKNKKNLIEFIPTQDLNHIDIHIINKYNKKIEIENFNINGQKQIVEYKLLPKNIGFLLSKFYIAGKSLPQRFYMYNDCLKIASDSPIVGNGGNTWKVVSRAVEEYKCKFKECHSYFFELLISYGIIGLVCFLILILVFFVKILKQVKNDKNVRKNKLLILFGLVILVLHCFIDFDMSFMLLQLVFYIYMAVLLYDNTENNNLIEKDFKIFNYKIKNNKFLKLIKIKRIIDYVLLIVLMIFLSMYIRSSISKGIVNNNTLRYQLTPYKHDYYYSKILDDIKNNQNYIVILNEFQDYMIKEPFYTQNLNYSNYFNIICQNIDSLSDNELEKYLNFGINNVKNIKQNLPLYFDSVLSRTQTLVTTLKNLENYINNNSLNTERVIIIKNTIEELKIIINKEYQVNYNNMIDMEKNGITEEEKNTIVEKYNKIVENIIKKEIN